VYKWRLHQRWFFQCAGYGPGNIDVAIARGVVRGGGRRGRFRAPILRRGKLADFLDCPSGLELLFATRTKTERTVGAEVALSRRIPGTYHALDAMVKV
jgi:hypothetical protein